MASIWEAEVPWSTVGICGGHSGDLLFEYVGMLPRIDEIVADWNFIGQFIMNHEKPQAWFEEHGKILNPTKDTSHFAPSSERRQARGLTKSAGTRFGSSYPLGDSLTVTKPSLVATVNDSRWSPFMTVQTYKDDSRRVKDLINDDDWWEASDATLNIFKPLWKLIRTGDSNIAAMDIIYRDWSDVSDKVKAAAEAAEGLEFFSSYPNTAVNTTLANTAAGKYGLKRAQTQTLSQDCVLLCQNRFGYAYNHYWGAGYALAPACIDVDHDEVDEEVMDSLEIVCNRLWHNDVSKAAKAFREYKTVYKAANSPFKVPSRLANIGEMPAYLWWQLYERHAPELAYVAMHVLSKQVGVGPVERSHKKLKSVVATKHRNRLHEVNQQRQVFVNMNGPILRNVANPDYFEPWNHDESNSDTDEDSSSEEDVAAPTAAPTAASNSE